MKIKRLKRQGGALVGEIIEVPDESEPDEELENAERLVDMAWPIDSESAPLSTQELLARATWAESLVAIQLAPEKSARLLDDLAEETGQTKEEVAAAIAHAKQLDREYEQWKSERGLRQARGSEADRDSRATAERAGLALERTIESYKLRLKDRNLPIGKRQRLEQALQEKEVEHDRWHAALNPAIVLDEWGRIPQPEFVCHGCKEPMRRAERWSKVFCYRCREEFALKAGRPFFVNA